MSDSSSLVGEKREPGRLLLLSLVISRFATQPPAILTGLLLIDIGLAFGCSVGIIGQIRTLSAVVTVVFALLMGVLSSRFNHKSLLMLGLVFYCISAIGCGFASSFNVMLVAYSLSGLGLAMVAPMANTLVATYFPLEKRPSVIGLILAGAALSFVIGAPTIGIIDGLWGWRIAFLGFALPISLLSLSLASKGIPPVTSGHKTIFSYGKYLEGFEAVFSNRSAVACLAGEVLRVSTFMVFYMYSISFLRQRYLISTGFASIIITCLALCYTLGSLITGRLVNRFGRKSLTVVATLISSVFAISFALSPNPWIAVALIFIGGLFSGINSSAAQSLDLEQVPEFRGAMMSLSTAALNMGEALGAGVGGLVLLVYNWEFVGLSLGLMGIVAALVYYIFVIDPTRNQ